VLIQKCKAARRRSESESESEPESVVDRKTIAFSHPAKSVIPQHRSDGVGVQAMVRICAQFLAQKNGFEYIHIPFLDVGHSDINERASDRTGQSWPDQWESFLNLGRGCVLLADMADSVGQFRLARDLGSRQDVSWNDFRLIAEKSNSNEPPDGKPPSTTIFRPTIQVCNRAREHGCFFTEDFLKALNARFRSGTYSPSRILFDDEHLDIAIHIRRGDVSEAIGMGQNERMYSERYLDNSFYRELLSTLMIATKNAPLPVRFNVFTDGTQSDFQDFDFSQPELASLSSGDGGTIPGIRFHFGIDTFETLYHLINASVFVPAKSSFSVLAVALGSGIVVVPDSVSEFPMFGLFEEIIQSSKRFHTLESVAKAPSDLHGPVP
jgi:hypothetical protein